MPESIYQQSLGLRSIQLRPPKYKPTKPFSRSAALTSEHLGIRHDEVHAGGGSDWVVGDFLHGEIGRITLFAELLQEQWVSETQGTA